MNDLTIRLAAAADIAAIAAIYGEAVTNGTGSFELDPPGEAEMAKRFDALAQSRHPWLAAEQRGEVVGYAYAGPYRARPAYRLTVEDAIYLAPAARGHGLGRRLLEALIAEATSRGYRQMIGVVGDSANTASVRVHLACGFVRLGAFTDVGWKHGRWLDTVLMQRPLGPGAGAKP